MSVRWAARYARSRPGMSAAERVLGNGTYLSLPQAKQPGYRPQTRQRRLRHQACGRAGDVRARRQGRALVGHPVVATATQRPPHRLARGRPPAFHPLPGPNYRTCVDRYLRPWLSAVPVGQVSGAVLTRHYAKLLEAGGHSAKSVRGVQGVQPPESGSPMRSPNRCRNSGIVSGRDSNPYRSTSLANCSGLA